MSHDVHGQVPRANINKISKAEVTSTRRCVRNNSSMQKDASSLADNPRQPKEMNDFLFGSISPRRSSQTNPTMMIAELESPDQTQRDTTESDNNISSCSTLDIVNKVS